MADCNVYRFSDGSVASQGVDTSAFGSRSPRRVLREAVLMYQANQRAGTHAALDRSDVTGSIKKPWKQKHTGRARAGRKSSPIWRSGGVAHGPHPRDYSYGVPRKALRAATRSAVAGKFLDGAVVFVDALALEEPSTRTMAKLLSALGVRGAFLLVLPEPNDFAWKSVRNIPGARMMTADDVNAYAVLRSRTVIFVGDALDKLAGRVGFATPAGEAN